MWILSEVSGAAARLRDMGSIRRRSRSGTSFARSAPCTAGMSYERLESLGGRLQWPCPFGDRPRLRSFLHGRLCGGARARARSAPFIHRGSTSRPVEALDDDVPRAPHDGAKRLDSYNTGVQSGGLRLAAAPPRDDRSSPPRTPRDLVRLRGRARAHRAIPPRQPWSPPCALDSGPPAEARVHDLSFPGSGGHQPDSPSTPPTPRAAPPSSRRRRCASRRSKRRRRSRTPQSDRAGPRRQVDLRPISRCPRTDEREA
jgi:hypothetical protein